MSMTTQQMIIFTRAAKRMKEIQDRELYENSLHEFFKAAWPQFDPSDFVDNWHLKAVAEHLEAVARGQIKRLLINVPPRTGKTNLCSICFPAWVWTQPEAGPLMGPSTSFFYASYAEQLSHEHSLKTRRLVESKWYQKHWGHRFKLVSDRNTKGHFENNQGGYRMATSVDARATGWGASLLCADDPHLVKETESDLIRRGVVQWWTETMPSRLNDRQTGAMIVVMQRIHEEDLSGYILTEELGYTHLCLPMCYDSARHCVTVLGSNSKGEEIKWEDPRTEEGQLLWPARFPAREVAKLEKEMGPYSFAGQMQQTPEPRGGGILKREWWECWDDQKAEENGAIKGTYPPCEYILAGLDTAYTEKQENDASALSIWGVWRDLNGNPKIILMLCWQERLELHDLVVRVGASCKKYKVDRLLIEDKAAGHSVSQELYRLFGSFDFGIELFDPKKFGDKVARVHAVVHLFSEGLIYAPDKAWADEMIDQCAVFPKGSHDDLVDSLSMSLIYLRRTGFAVHKAERALEVADELAYRPKTGALYPV